LPAIMTNPVPDRPLELRIRPAPRPGFLVWRDIRAHQPIGKRLSIINLSVHDSPRALLSRDGLPVSVLEIRFIVTLETMRYRCHQVAPPLQSFGGWLCAKLLLIRICGSAFYGVLREAQGRAYEHQPGNRPAAR